MTTVDREHVRREVLEYVRHQSTPIRVGALAEELRKKSTSSKWRDPEVRDVVQSMIVTGKLSYAPGLKIKLGGKT